MKRVCAIILSLFCLFLAGSMGDAYGTPGVTDKEVKVGIVLDLTASNAYYGRQTLAAVKAITEYENDKGGINGRKVNLVVHEAGDNPLKAVAAYKYVVSRHNIFMIGMGMGSAALRAVFPFIEEKKIPMTGVVSLSSSMYNPFRRYVFSTHGGSFDHAIVALDYLVNTLRHSDPRFKGKEIRLGINFQDDDYGRDFQRAWRLGAKKYGLKIVAEESFKRGSIDVASQVLNLRKAGANYVFQTAASPSGIAALQEAYKLDYHPQFIGDTGMRAKKVIDVAQEAADGFWVITSTASTREDVPGMRRLKKISKKYQPDAKIDGIFLWGWVNYLVGVEGLKRAGRDLTREGLIDALETFKARPFSTEGLSGDIIYSSKSHKGGGSMRMFRADLKEKDFILFTDWMRPSIEEPIKKR